MEQIATVDWVIIGVVLISTAISIVRGFVKEALSLVTLVVAIFVSRMFGAQASSLLVGLIDVPSLRLVAAYAMLFFATMITGGIVNYLIVQVVRMEGLSGTDRVFGMVFGFARGALVVIIAVALMSRLPFREDPWWQASMLIPHIQVSADWLQVIVMENVDEITGSVKDQVMESSESI